MIQILKTLNQISTGYTVFEKDQVLTASQLNSLSGYFEDQTRLSRTLLFGVGIVCGLKASVQGNRIRLTRGSGVTTDGDLIYLAEDTIFLSYRVFDETNPSYPNFYPGERLIPIFELSKEKGEKRTTPLSNFTESSGFNYSDMVSVLYMESYIYDPDLCSDTDCDNRGQELRNNIKVLLIPKSYIQSLTPAIDTADEAFVNLSEIVIKRPLLNTSVTSSDQLAYVYKAACSEMNKNIDRCLKDIVKNCEFLIKNIFTKNPVDGWLERLNEINSYYIKTETGIQYYYDFLKDLSETYNQFYHLLFGDTTLCCPSPGLFPKHLLLGNLSDAKNATENRTAFYPSVRSSNTTENIEHAKFLLKKLDVLINTFKVPVQHSPDIRITPSLSEESACEDRAIPYYYQLNRTFPIQVFWNYQLFKRGMGNCNYSYNAIDYGARGAAASPLEVCIGKYPFFRIEGHLGVDVAKAQSIIEKKIADMNLPFIVRSLLLGTDKGKIALKPGIRYGDLHRFHYVLRQDILQQMTEVKEFSNQFRTKVNDAIRDKLVIDTSDGNDGASVRDTIDEKDNNIVVNADNVQKSMSQNYTEFQKTSNWRSGMNQAIKTSAEIKNQLGKIVKTEFPTPFDSLISSSHYQWLDWIDEIIKRKDDKEDERLLFHNFIKEYHGMEHAAGVTKGGTFILVYDTKNQVIGDFMLPFYCPEIAEQQADEPEIRKPALRDPIIITGGVRVIKPVDRIINDKVDYVKIDLIRDKLDMLDTNVNNRLDRMQLDYFNSIQNSFSTVSNVLIARNNRNTDTGVLTEITNPSLERKMQEVNEREKMVLRFREKASEVGITAKEKVLYNEMAKEMEMELATSVQETARIVSESNMDVSPGTEGYTAMMEVNYRMSSIENEDTRNAVQTNLQGIQKTTGNLALNQFLGRIIKK